MRLGYSLTPVIGCGRLRCFNEAEAHAPRIPPADNAPADNAPAGFNEAEAHAPRIPGDGTASGSGIESFNEAEAHAPRIRIQRG